MSKVNPEADNDLREEYDLATLEIRRLGPGRKSFRGIDVHLEPDVARVFTNSKSVNEALRFLIRVTRDSGYVVPKD
jgi:hypothetical protein